VLERDKLEAAADAQAAKAARKAKARARPGSRLASKIGEATETKG
jgi:hypothetical protein